MITISTHFNLVQNTPLYLELIGVSILVRIQI